MIINTIDDIIFHIRNRYDSKISSKWKSQINLKWKWGHVYDKI